MRKLPVKGGDELLQCSIIALDKPSNYDSHQTAALVKKLLGVGKVGHSGTLDPKVTGVLTILIGKATRLASYLLSSSKEYVGVMHLHEDASINKLKNTIRKKFLGKIKQLPPRKAAVRRQERKREIYSFKIIEKKGKDILFKVSCEAGTYIRKLVHDLGLALGVGAHMLELRRTKDGIFREDDCITLYDVVKAIKSKKLSSILLPVETITKDMLKITVKDSALKKIYNGSPIFEEFVLRKGKKQSKNKKNNIVAVFSKEGRLVEIARAVKEKKIIAKPITVLAY